MPAAAGTEPGSAPAGLIGGALVFALSGAGVLVIELGWMREFEADLSVAEVALYA